MQQHAKDIRYEYGEHVVSVRRQDQDVVAGLGREKEIVRDEA
jgi:hypothetical protein